MSHMLGPINTQFILVWINFINFIIWNYSIIFTLIKNMKIRKLLKFKRILQKMLAEKKNDNKFIKIF